MLVFFFFFGSGVLRKWVFNCGENWVFDLGFFMLLEDFWFFVGLFMKDLNF